MTILQGVLGVAAQFSSAGEVLSVFYDSGFTTSASHSTSFTTISDGSTPLEVTLQPNKLYVLDYHLRVARDGASVTHRVRLLASAAPDQAIGFGMRTSPLADSTDPMITQSGSWAHFILADLDTSPGEYRQQQTSSANPAAATKFDGSCIYKTGSNQVVVSLQHAYLTGSGALGVRSGTRLIARELVPS